MKINKLKIDYFCNSFKLNLCIASQMGRETKAVSGLAAHGSRFVP